MKTTFAPNRRTFLKELLLLGPAVAAVRSADPTSAAIASSAELPKIKFSAQP